MGRWIRYFIGTPPRLVTTLSVIGAVVVIINPGLLRMAVERLLIEISPLFGPVIQLAFIVFAFRVMLSIFFGGKK